MELLAGFRGELAEGSRRQSREQSVSVCAVRVVGFEI
jgi:hypothetical protein